MSSSPSGNARRPDPPSGCVDVAGLAERHRPAVLRYFRHHLGSAEDAEDLTQEAFVRLSQQPAETVRGLANVEAYLLRIASNLLRDRFRRETSHRSADHVPIDDIVHSLPGEEPSSERVYENKMHLQLFLEALAELPPRCHEVFLLQRYDGLTYSAIAKRLGISVSAVEKHMMRAMLHLNTRLEQA